MKQKQSTCEVRECHDDRFCKNLCSLHYSRLYRTGSITRSRNSGPKPKPRENCSEPSCSRQAKSQGMCPVHYAHLRKRKICDVPGCQNLFWSKGLCSKHRSRLMRGHDPYTWEPSPHSYRYLTSEGYITIYIPETKKRVLEHRKIVEQFLNRKLKKYEEVHHKNGVKTDNRLENLEVWVSSQPSGQRVPDLVEWAITLLKEYDPDKLA